MEKTLTQKSFKVVKEEIFYALDEETKEKYPIDKKTELLYDGQNILGYIETKEEVSESSRMIFLETKVVPTYTPNNRWFYTAYLRIIKTDFKTFDKEYEEDGLYFFIPSDLNLIDTKDYYISYEACIETTEGVAIRFDYCEDYLQEEVSMVGQDSLFKEFGFEKLLQLPSLTEEEDRKWFNKTIQVLIKSTTTGYDGDYDTKYELVGYYDEAKNLVKL